MASVLIALLFLKIAVTVLTQRPLSSWQDGIATNYGGAQDGLDPYTPSFGTKDGACGYGVLDKEQYPFWSVAGMATSSPFYKEGPVQGCGQCFQIECVNDGDQFQGRCNPDPSQRSVTVMITDACPECAPNQFDIQALTFNKVAPMAIGRIAMRYRRVECAPPANIEVKVDKFSGSGGWIRLLVQETGGPGAVKTIQLKGPNTGWQGMNNIWGAAWELSNCPQTPIDVRIVGSDGQEVTAFGAIKSDGVTGVLPTGVQFSFGKISQTADSSDTSSSGNEPMVSAFSGPADGSDAASSPSSDDPVPCITAFSGTKVDPSNCATGGSQSASNSSSGGGSSSSAASGPTGSPSGKNYTSTSGKNSTSTSPSPPPPAGPARSPPPPSSSSSSASPSPPPPRGNSPAGPTTPPSPYLRGSSGSATCDDQQPPGGYSCAQQKSYGACSQQWMWQWSSDRPKGYCAKTCGFCS